MWCSKAIRCYCVLVGHFLSHLIFHYFHHFHTSLLLIFLFIQSPIFEPWTFGYKGFFLSDIINVLDRMRIIEKSISILLHLFGDNMRVLLFRKFTRFILTSNCAMGRELFPVIHKLNKQPKSLTFFLSLQWNNWLNPFIYVFKIPFSLGYILGMIFTVNYSKP